MKDLLKEGLVALVLLLLVVMITCNHSPTGFSSSVYRNPEIAWTTETYYDRKLQELSVIGKIINRTSYPVNLTPMILLSSDREGLDTVGEYRGVLADSIYYNYTGVPRWIRVNDLSSIPAKTQVSYVIDTGHLGKIQSENDNLFYYVWFER